MKYFLIYLLIVNALGFLLMLEDKRRAKKNRWRIRERTLIGVAVIGGSIGSLAGMYVARHKTMHAKFFIGIPVILALQLMLGVYLFAKYAK